MTSIEVRQLAGITTYVSVDVCFSKFFIRVSSLNKVVD